MNDTRISFAVESMIATITLNRPEKLNAIDPPMLDGLQAAFTQIEQNNDIRVVVLTGTGERAFCVGADINAWSALEPMDMWRQWIHWGHGIFNHIAGLRQPVIAALNGYTFGGGLELALAADLRLAADHVELALPEVTIATIPGWGGTHRLPALIGVGRAKQMIMTGDRVDAVTAERWGLVNAVHPPADLLPRAMEMAQRIAGNAPASVQIAKQLLDAGMDGRTTNQTLEALAGALAATTDDAQEGLAAFREKRTPEFKGS